MPRSLRVFLCHSSKDKVAVRELYKKLRAETWIDPWLDEEKLFPGQDWHEEIEKAVEITDVVIVLLSNQSVSQEGFVQRELKLALDVAEEKPENTIFIIPLRLDDCPAPRRLRGWHYVDYFPADRKDWVMERLIASLKLRAEALGIKTAIPEKVEQEAKEKANREAVEEAAREKLEFEAVEKAKREKAQREADELVRKTAIEKINREAKEKAEREEREAKEKIKRQTNPVDSPIVITQMIFGLSVLVLFAWGVYTIYLSRIPKQSIDLPVATATVFSPTDIATPVSPTLTNVPFTPTPQPTETISSLPTLAPIFSEKDGMTLLYVSEGNFTMGSDGNSDEQPVHQVYLDSFWIDQVEVTNAMYAKCVNAGKCALPGNTNLFSNLNYADHPVVYVDWNRANSYCSWAGRRLPTEAEWEKAARGADGRTYPWGEDISCDKANYGSCVFNTSPVGIYKSGKSPYGAYDMVGNVWEWVSSLHKPYPYDAKDGRENMSSSGDRLLRGSSWNLSDYYARSAVRYWVAPDSSNNVVGFRCARSQ